MVRLDIQNRVMRRKDAGSGEFDRLLFLLCLPDLADDEGLLSQGVKPSQNVLCLFCLDDENHSNPVVEGPKHLILWNIPFSLQKGEDGGDFP